jgi:hypothetical protein
LATGEIKADLLAISLAATFQYFHHLLTFWVDFVFSDIAWSPAYNLIAYLHTSEESDAGVFWL